MYLTSLSVRNFMPFKGWHQLAFPEDKSRNIVLIFGDNMRGKTSLLNAFRWAFYSRAVDRYGAEIPLQRLVNLDAASENDWLMDVKVCFTHEGQSFELTRSASRQPAVGSPQRPEDFHIDTALRRDGELVRGDKIEHEINQIVPEQISRFFLFDGELLQEYEALLVEDGEQGKKIKDAIEQVLGVPALVQGKDDLRVLRKPFDKQMEQDLRQNKQVNHFTEKLSDLGREGEQLEAAKDELAKKLASTKKEYQELQQRVDSSEARYLQRQELDQHVATRLRIEETSKALEERKLDAARDSWLDLLRPKFEQALSHLQDQIAEDTAAIREEAERSQRSALWHTSLEQGICALCEVDLADVASDRFQALLAAADGTKSIGELSTRLADANTLARRLSQVRYPNAKKAFAEIANSTLRLTVEDTHAASEIDRLKVELANFDSAEMLRVRRSAENAHHAVRQLDSKLEEVQRKLESNRSDQDKLLLVINQNKSARDQRSSRIVDLVSGVERVFSGAISRLRDDLRSDIEQKATAAFKALTTDKSYAALRINKSYGLTIVDELGRDVSLRSAGAEQIVALSLIDALNRTGRSAGPIIMDTPFGRLDPKHRAHVLRYLPQAAPQVVLFVHEGEVDKAKDLSDVASKIGAVYALERVSSSQTKLVRQ